MLHDIDTSYKFLIRVKIHFGLGIPSWVKRGSFDQEGPNRYISYEVSTGGGILGLTKLPTKNYTKILSKYQLNGP